MSNFQDQELDCVDCGRPFTFTSGEQEFYNEKGYSAPKRCKNCRHKKKLRNGDGNNQGHGRARYDD